jgi:hypothetical protein
MKDIKEYLINENQINESITGIAAGVVAGIIGYKMLKALIKGLAGKLGLSVAKKKLKELDDIQNEMKSILEKYPEAQKKMKNTYRHILSGKGGKRDSFFLAESGAFLDKDIEAFSDEDKDRFKKLFEQVKKIQDGIFKNFSDWDLMSIEDK